jgi:hypothetical protein
VRQFPSPSGMNPQEIRATFEPHVWDRGKE